MADWYKTQIMKHRLDLEGKLQNIDGRAYYQGRPVIHRDSQIDGGVCLGQGKREAIVVDSQKYPKLRELYEAAKGKAMEDGIVRKEKILQAVYDTVTEAIPVQSSTRVKRLLQALDIGKDEKISLDVFLEYGVGVCRHDALACAALLELFKKDGFVNGKPSVDRNSDKGEGHAWCRYTNSIGEVCILDVMLKYIGNLTDASEDIWHYKRPEDF